MPEIHSVFDVPQPEGVASPSDADLFRLAFEENSDGIIVLGVEHGWPEPRIVLANRAFCRLTGFAAEQLIGATPDLLRISESDCVIREALVRPASETRPVAAEATAQKSDGSTFAVEMLLVPVANGNRPAGRWIVYFRDITERKAQEARLRYQVLHDVLTDLPNRTLLLDRLEQALLAGRRTSIPLALMVMDVDRFKDVNDTFGHHTGDLLLAQVSKRLREQVRASDTVARIGGDEFGLLLPAVEDMKDASKIARKIVKAFDRPFIIEGKAIMTGVSIGICLAPEHASDSETLLRRADVAMYVAKESGSGYAFYSEEHDQRESASFALAAELRDAIPNGELVLHYQPKVHIRSGLMTRVEVLVRWRHPQLGLLYPDHFIPVAERNGLIGLLTEYVLDAALQQCREWHDRGLPIHVAVNLSPRTLQESSIAETVARLLERWGLEPRALKLEITESSVLTDPAQVLAILSLLQGLGVRLSLDDFGTGYSSLVHLRQLPVDEIKIDKSFIMAMGTSESDAAIVRATISLAHNLGRQVVAEGVESEAIYTELLALGCDLAQGYYLSAPVPAVDLIEWLERTDWGLAASPSGKESAARGTMPPP